MNHSRNNYFNNKFNNLFKDQSTNEKVSFKELSAWGVFRPLAVDAALINGKVINLYRFDSGMDFMKSYTATE